MGIADSPAFDLLFLGGRKAFPLVTIPMLPIVDVDSYVFTRITLTSLTNNWYPYLPLSHFEALLLGVVLLEIFVMRYFLILPLDISKLIQNGTLLATDVSRKKRMVPGGTLTEISGQQQLAETMFATLRRLDEDDCLLRTLCELEFSSARNRAHYPKKVSKLLSYLKRLGRKRIHVESLNIPDNITITERKILSHFEEAVLVGTGNRNAYGCNSYSLEESCESYYSLCTAKSDELLGYAREIEPFLNNC